MAVTVAIRMASRGQRQGSKKSHGCNLPRCMLVIVVVVAGRNELSKQKFLHFQDRIETASYGTTFMLRLELFANNGDTDCAQAAAKRIERMRLGLLGLQLKKCPQYRAKAS